MQFFDAATIRARLPWPRTLAALDGPLRAEVQAPLPARVKSVGFALEDLAAAEAVASAEPSPPGH